MQESKFLTNRHFLICFDEHIEPEYKLQYDNIINNFCGTVVKNTNDFKIDNDKNVDVYLCGNIEEIFHNTKFDKNNKKIFVIKELSHNYSFNNNLIDVGKIPININNVGVYFSNCFDNSINYFDCVNNSHKFQNLTESNKPSNAFRTGLYLSNVTELNNNLKFNLLRCSSNFEGPTENFREIDNKIISHLNNVANKFFENNSNFNHVLAQIYKNTYVNNTSKKAKIKQHSDKTKDMPKNGLIAFCTFYKDMDKFQKLSNNNYNVGNSTILTKLRFKLKDPINYPNHIRNFDIILEPNSVFIINLETNRLYTHEIVPSNLPSSSIPTRMGYVVRCSNVEAIYSNDKTRILKNNLIMNMENTTDELIIKLKNQYYEENMTTNIVEYDDFLFSLNKGDYMKPII